MGRSTSLITIFLHPSNGLTTILLRLIGVPLKDSLKRVDFGMTLRDELISINMPSRVLFMQLIEMLSARL